MGNQVPEVEVAVNDYRIEIWYQGRHYASFGIDEKTRAFTVHLARRADTAISATPLGLTTKLDVSVRAKDPLQEAHVALPRRLRKPAKTQIIKATRSEKNDRASVSADQIAGHVRDQVKIAILDSLLDNPGQSKVFTQAETRRIAKKYKEGVFVVAGVRAALTRGTYGDQAKLLESRRRERRAGRA